MSKSSANTASLDIAILSSKRKISWSNRLESNQFGSIMLSCYWASLFRNIFFSKSC